MRKLIYIDSKEPVRIGDQHRLCNWTVEVVAIHDVGQEAFRNGSVTIRHKQGYRLQETTWACNIGAEWVAA